MLRVLGVLGEKSFQLSTLVRVGLSSREHLVRPHPPRCHFDALADTSEEFYIQHLWGWPELCQIRIAV